MQTKRILSFDSVSFQYHDKLVFEGASFEVHLGEFVYVIGKTGVGKSSLLKLIYADQAPQSGTITFGETLVNNLPSREIPYLRRKMGIVFQDFQLLPDRSVYENIAFALRACDWTGEGKIRARVMEVLDKVGMSHKAEAYPHQLSGGEQQRVVIARALINDPLLLLADEPTGNLDPESTTQIMDLLQKINISGTAILMVTHEHTLLNTYPARALYLTGKSVIAYEKSHALLRDLYGK